ncbi:MAG: AAA family ATPase [Desulfobacteraceae bacterium]|nr:AAA family ATPase [Desulfobacteraceae bacterium]
MAQIERIPTGVPGLDELIEGGLPKGRITLITGAAGSGKTTLGMQFLYNGCTSFGENGLFVTLEEETADLIKDMSRYGWELEQLADQGRFSVLQSPIPFEVSQENMNIDSLLDNIHQQAMKVDAKRIVFDSIASLGLPYGDAVTLRRDVLRIGAMLRELGCTTLLLTEMLEGEARITRYGIEQFVAHGVIALHVTPTYRAIQVVKMRGTNHDMGIHRLRITEKGIVVMPGERPF